MYPVTRGTCIKIQKECEPNSLTQNVKYDGAKIMYTAIATALTNFIRHVYVGFVEFVMHRIPFT